MSNIIETNSEIVIKAVRNLKRGETVDLGNDIVLTQEDLNAIQFYFLINQWSIAIDYVRGNNLKLTKE